MRATVLKEENRKIAVINPLQSEDKIAQYLNNGKAEKSRRD
jgi:hypothetical protein